MPNSQKARVHVEYDGKLSSHKRNDKQTDARAVNREGLADNPSYLTPWQKAKAKRQAKRRAAGKTFENWLKNQTYRTTGKNSVSANEVDLKTDSTKRTRNDRAIQRDRDNRADSIQAADGADF